MTNPTILQILHQEMAPAVGCTEPVAVALACAEAREILGKIPDSAKIRVSRNIMKNAMGVGIPGTNETGIAMAAAMGILAGNAAAKLEVLHGIPQEDIKKSRHFAAQQVKISLKQTDKKLYIEAELHAGEDSSLVVIEEDHTNITHRMRNGREIGASLVERENAPVRVDESGLTVREICDFIRRVDAESLSILDDCIRINWQMAESGMNGRYGLNVGSNLMQRRENGSAGGDPENYAIAMTAAAADARMAGSTLPVMTLCGSGNQGLTATLPVIAYCRATRADEEKLHRALALSCLITIHVKYYLGKLSPLCGCGVGSSIGVCCALTWLSGGEEAQIENAIRNMAADVSGIICDGAKAGCALKIATVIGSAFQCARLALCGSGAGDLDGIVADDVETTIQNIGKLGKIGMAGTDQVILNLMTQAE